MKRIKILFATSSRDLNQSILAKLILRNAIKLAYTQHMQLGVGKKDWFHTWEYSHLDAWITPLSWLANQLKEMTKIREDKVHVIPLGIELNRFGTAAHKKSEARSLLALPKEKKIVGIVGRLDRGKGQEYLISAIRKARDAGEDVDSLIVGDDTKHENQLYSDFLQTRTTELGLTRNIHFRSFREDIETAFQAMDIFALTSLSETYGMVTIEAMATGLPVIATDSAGTPEIIHHEKTGLLVPPGNADALAEAILFLLRNPDEQERLAKNAREEARSRFSHETQCALTENLIFNLATGM